jgi:hypothetical protein
MTATPIQNTSASVDLGAFTAAKHEYCSAGQEPNSNVQAGGCGVGGPQADSRIVRADVSGIGPDTDSNITAAGESIA